MAIVAFSFGGFGDILALAQLVKNVLQQLTGSYGASNAYQALILELGAMHDALLHVERLTAPAGSKAAAPLSVTASYPFVATAAGALGSPGGGGGPTTGRPSIVQCTFTTSLPDELSISTGESVRVVTEYDDGWALCANARGERGVVPLECLDNGTGEDSAYLGAPEGGSVISPMSASRGSVAPCSGSDMGGILFACRLSVERIEVRIACSQEKLKKGSPGKRWKESWRKIGWSLFREEEIGSYRNEVRGHSLVLQSIISTYNSAMLTSLCEAAGLNVCGLGLRSALGSTPPHYTMSSARNPYLLSPD